MANQDQNTDQGGEATQEAVDGIILTTPSAPTSAGLAESGVTLAPIDEPDFNSADTWREAADADDRALAVRSWNNLRSGDIEGLRDVATDAMRTGIARGMQEIAEEDNVDLYSMSPEERRRYQLDQVGSVDDFDGAIGGRVETRFLGGDLSVSGGAHRDGELTGGVAWRYRGNNGGRDDR